jgi:pilus assembly protein Flp/PilA
VIYLYSKVSALWATRDQGASAVEYGLLIAAIAAIIVGVVFTLGTKVKAGFSTTCTAMPAGTGTGSCS